MSTRSKVAKFVLTASTITSLSWLVVANTNFKRYFEEYPELYDWLLYSEQMTRQTAGEPNSEPILGLDADLTNIQLNLKHPSRLQEALQTLSTKVQWLKQTHTKESKLISDLQQAIIAQKEKADKELKVTKQDIIQHYESSIASQLSEKEKILKAEYDALLDAQQVHLKQQFNREVSELVETERQGKLQKLGLLESELNELEFLTEQVSQDNHLLRQYITLYHDVNQLKSDLQHSTTTLELQPTDAFVANILPHLPQKVHSFEELQAQFLNTYPELSRTALLKSQPSVLNKFTNLLNQQFDWKLSNEVEEFPRMTFWRYFTISILSKFIFPWQNEIDELLLKIKKGNLDISEDLKKLGPWPNALLKEWTVDVQDYKTANELLQVFCD